MVKVWRRNQVHRNAPESNHEREAHKPSTRVILKFYRIGHEGAPHSPSQAVWSCRWLPSGGPGDSALLWSLQCWLEEWDPLPEPSCIYTTPGGSGLCTQAQTQPSHQQALPATNLSCSTAHSASSKFTTHPKVYTPKKHSKMRFLYIFFLHF